MPNQILELKNAHTLNYSYLVRMCHEHIHDRFAKAKAFINCIATCVFPCDVGGIALIDFIDFIDFINSMYLVNAKVRGDLRRCSYVSPLESAL